MVSFLHSKKEYGQLGLVLLGDYTAHVDIHTALLNSKSPIFSTDLML